MAYFLIDGMYLTHRSHHGNIELATSAGKLSGTFFGYLRTLIALRKKFPHEKFAVCWDSTTNLRKEIDPRYKAGRHEIPGGFWEQRDDIQEALDALGIDQWICEGYEADDIFATLVKRFEDQGLITIYTKDKDMLQLVHDGKVVVLSPGSRGIPDKYYDEEAVQLKFRVPAQDLVNYRALDGDSSDNLPGIHRVPRKILAGLINKFHTLDNVFYNISSEKLTPFQKEGIITFQDRAYINHKIMSLEAHLPNLTLRHTDTQDTQKLTDLLEKYEIRATTIDPDSAIALFKADIEIRYNDPEPVLHLDTEDMFEDDF